MTKGFTQDDVLRFIYKETKEEESQAIEYHLIINSQLMDYYKETVETIQKLNAIRLEPSKSTIEKIINYSTTYSYESIG